MPTTTTQEEAFSGQDYFPEELGRQTFYDPPERGFEREIRKRLDYWAKLRKDKAGTLMLRRLVLAACAIGAAWVSSAPAPLSRSSAAGRSRPRLCSRARRRHAATAALVATDTSLSWFDGYCRIGKMYKAKAVYVQAHCGGKATCR